MGYQLAINKDSKLETPVVVMYWTETEMHFFLRFGVATICMLADADLCLCFYAFCYVALYFSTGSNCLADTNLSLLAFSANKASYFCVLPFFIHCNVCIVDASLFLSWSLSLMGEIHFGSYLSSIERYCYSSISNLDKFGSNAFITSFIGNISRKYKPSMCSCKGLFSHRVKWCLWCKCKLGRVFKHEMLWRYVKLIYRVKTLMLVKLLLCKYGKRRRKGVG